MELQQYYVEVQMENTDGKGSSFYQTHCEVRISVSIKYLYQRVFSLSDEVRQNTYRPSDFDADLLNINPVRDIHLSDNPHFTR